MTSAIHLCHTRSALFFDRKKERPNTAVKAVAIHTRRPVCSRILPQRQIPMDKRDDQNNASEGFMDSPERLDCLEICGPLEMQGMRTEKAQPQRSRHDHKKDDIQPAEKNIHRDTSVGQLPHDGDASEF